MNSRQSFLPDAAIDSQGAVRVAAPQVHALRQWTLDRQLALVDVLAPTGDEARRGNVMQHALLALGLAKTAKDDAVNVIARVTQPALDDRAPIVVMAHLDTVYADRIAATVRRDGSRMYAPGISDNGRGLAAMLTMAAVLAPVPERERHRMLADITRPIELVATVGEEGAGNLRGAKHYLDSREARGLPMPAAVIALDGPGDSLVVHHGIASHRLRVTFRGPGGHPWADVDHANAIHAASTAMTGITRLAALQPRGVTLNITRMGGGESLTALPQAAWFELDLRTLDAADMAPLRLAVQRIVCAPCRGVTVACECLGDRPGGALDAQHPLVQLANDATRRHGSTPQSASASTDANVALARGIPAIAIGAGGSGGAVHSIDEWYDDTNGPRGIVRALDIVLSAAGNALRN